MRRRVRAGVLLVIVVIVGLVVHGVLPESAFADIAGDALYVGAAYLALVVVLPRLRPWIVGSIALAWAAGVELLQLTGVPQQGALIRFGGRRCEGSRCNGEAAFAIFALPVAEDLGCPQC